MEQLQSPNPRESLIGAMSLELRPPANRGREWNFRLQSPSCIHESWNSSTLILHLTNIENLGSYLVSKSGSSDQNKPELQGSNFIVKSIYWKSKLTTLKLKLGDLSRVFGKSRILVYGLLHGIRANWSWVQILGGTTRRKKLHPKGNVKKYSRKIVQTCINYKLI